jgi:dTDP-4-amino-4,6-dideoxygalactose transaminase
MIFGAFPYFDEESIELIAKDIRVMLKSGKLTDGPHALEFEKKFAEYNKIKHALQSVQVHQQSMLPNLL